MERPDALERATANRLAELFRTVPVPQVIGLLSQLGISARAPEVPPAAPPGERPAAAGRIGAWTAVSRDGETVYERTADDYEAYYWADVQRFPARSAAPRIVLVGESVARGFFHDPDFNFAIALRQALHAGAPGALVDIVDLARTSIDARQLVGLVQAAMTLSPAVVVVFAGNNWHPFTGVSRAECQEVGRQLRERQQLDVVREHMESICRARTRDVIAHIGRLSAASSVPVLFVLPDFNLMDWHDTSTRHLPFTRDDGAAWFRLAKRLEDALRARNMTRARRLADGLVAIDRGSTSVGSRALAAIAASEGDRASARRYLEQARDAVLFTPSWTSRLVSARCYSAVQETIRREGPACGVHVLDLPRRVDEWSDAPAPGRRFFLDHCHLTADGMRLAAAAAAERLLPLLGHEAAPWRRLAGWSVPAPSDTMAMAHLFAAAFNAARGQDAEVVAHHCHAAIELERGVVDDFATLAALHVQSTPAGMTRLCADMLERHRSATPTRGSKRLMFLMGDPRAANHVQWHLVDAICAATAPVDSRIGESVARTARALYSVSAQHDVDLLDPRFSTMSPYDLEAVFRDSGTDLGDLSPASPAYYAAFSPRSSFRLIADGAGAIELTLTLRVRNAPGCRVRVSVNGSVVAAFRAGRRWTRRRFPVNGSAITAGVNWVAIEWPLCHRPQGLSEAACALLDGRVPEFYPSYGEVCAFTASLAAAQS